MGMHWEPTPTGYTLRGYAGRADLVRTQTPRGRACWTLHTDTGVHLMPGKASFDHAERVLGL